MSFSDQPSSTPFRPFLDIKTASTIATSLSFTPNSITTTHYYNLPKSQLSRLQHIQNSLARAVVKAPKFSHTPILKSLQVNERILNTRFFLSHTRFSLLLNLLISIT